MGVCAYISRTTSSPLLLYKSLGVRVKTSLEPTEKGNPGYSSSGSTPTSRQESLRTYLCEISRNMLLLVRVVIVILVRTRDVTSILFFVWCLGRTRTDASAYCVFVLDFFLAVPGLWCCCMGSHINSRSHTLFPVCRRCSRGSIISVDGVYIAATHAPVSFPVTHLSRLLRNYVPAYQVSIIYGAN